MNGIVFYYLNCAPLCFIWLPTRASDRLCPFISSRKGLYSWLYYDLLGRVLSRAYKVGTIKWSDHTYGLQTPAITLKLTVTSLLLFNGSSVRETRLSNEKSEWGSSGAHWILRLEENHLGARLLNHKGKDVETAHERWSGSIRHWETVGE